MRIGFLVDEWNELDFEQSTTILLLQESYLRGHDVFIFHAKDFIVQNNVVHCYVKRIKEAKKYVGRPVPFYRKITFEFLHIPLYALDCIFIRKEPPISPLVLNFLDSVQHDTFIINDINGIRQANNKLYTTTFVDPHNSFLPITHVSKNKEQLKRLIQETEGDKLIMKPLDGSRGRGVIVIEKKAQSNLDSLLDFYLDNNKNDYLIVQQYLDAVLDGDIRVMMLNGIPIGAYKRIPPEGEIRANIHVGGVAHKHALTSEQDLLCRKIGKKLRVDGIFFAGIDLIGNILIEVNVLNPGGIFNINKFNGTKLQKKVIDFIEETIGDRVEKRNEVTLKLKRFHQVRDAA